MSTKTLADVLQEPERGLTHPGDVDLVFIEGHLPRDAFWIARRHHRARIHAASVRAKRPSVLAEELSQQWISERRQVADGAHADSLQARGRRRTTAGKPGERQRGEEGGLVSRRDDDQAARFAQFGADFRHKFRARDADADIQSALALDLVAQPNGDALGRSHQRILAGAIQVRLIQRDRLDDRRVVVEDVEDRARRFPIRLEVTGHEDRLWTQAPGAAERHRRAHAEGPGLIRRGCDDTPLTGYARPTDDYRLAA